MNGPVKIHWSNDGAGTNRCLLCSVLQEPGFRWLQGLDRSQHEFSGQRLRLARVLALPHRTTGDDLAGLAMPKITQLPDEPRQRNPGFRPTRASQSSEGSVKPTTKPVNLAAQWSAPRRVDR
jgi:hypothetical protein